MKNIGVYLRNDPNQGGVYQYWMSIVDALASKSEEQEFHIVLFAENYDWKFLSEKYNLEYEILRQDMPILKIINTILRNILPYPLFKKNCKVWSPHYEKILKYSIDIMFAPSPKNITEDLHIKSVSPIFDLMHLYEPRFDEVSVNKKVRERANKKICKNASFILADSFVGKNQIIESYSKKIKNLNEKVQVLPYIPADYIYNVTELKEPVNTGFDKYIFYPAQFWSHKNHHNLLLAISKLKRKEIVVNLVCVGSDKNALENVKKLIDQENLSEQVKIMGYVSNDDIVSLYQHARALVMPSFFGPTNIPQLEAFVLGCPVATSAIYGIPEQVGDAALLFNPNSIDEIAECIEKLWMNDELCRDMVERGKEKAGLWGLQQYADTLVEIINSL